MEQLNICLVVEQFSTEVAMFRSEYEHANMVWKEMKP